MPERPCARSRLRRAHGNLPSSFSHQLSLLAVVICGRAASVGTLTTADWISLLWLRLAGLLAAVAPLHQVTTTAAPPQVLPSTPVRFESLKFKCKQKLSMNSTVLQHLQHLPGSSKQLDAGIIRRYTAADHPRIADICRNVCESSCHSVMFYDKWALRQSVHHSRDCVYAQCTAAVLLPVKAMLMCTAGNWPAGSEHSAPP